MQANGVLLISGPWLSDEAVREGLGAPDGARGNAVVHDC